MSHLYTYSVCSLIRNPLEIMVFREIEGWQEKCFYSDAEFHEVSVENFGTDVVISRNYL